MKIGDRIFVRGYIDEIRKDTVIIRNNGGYFGTIPSEVITGELPSAQPERMTNRQWIDFLSAQFDISRTSAKEMLHGMMQWKKKDNFKKLFNRGRAE